MVFPAQVVLSDLGCSRNSILPCGTYPIDFVYVITATLWLSRKGYLTIISAHRSARMIAAIKLDRQRRLSDVLGISMWNATDPRDQVFGLIDDDARRHPLLQPDYTKSVAEVYCNALRYMIQVDETGKQLADILQRAEEPLLETPAGFPSWVPRWEICGHKDYSSSLSSLRYARQSGEPWTACGKTCQQIVHAENPRILSIKGLILNTLDIVRHCLHVESGSDWKRIEMLRKSISELPSRYKEPDSIQEAFARTIIFSYIETVRNSHFGAPEL